MKSILLRPSGKDYIWGGTRLKTEFGKAFLPEEPLAESWECSVHPDGPSYVASGPEEGRQLLELLAEHPEYLGTAPSISVSGTLPILVKLIDVKSDLSVQVHPDDDYANRMENGQAGKTELWYVVDAEPGAQIVFGFSKSTTREELRRSLEDGTVEQYLNHIPVQSGDVFFITAGTIHAIGKGVLIAEIQQSSNLTYRLYDYGRLGKDGKPRPLHIDKALDVVKLFGSHPLSQPKRVLRRTAGFVHELLCSSPYFQVDRCMLKAENIMLEALPESFRVLLCLSGEGVLNEGGEQLPFRKGQTVFIPATAKDLSLSGDATFLLIRG